jgi:hypothetical protein
MIGRRLAVVWWIKHIAYDAKPPQLLYYLPYPMSGKVMSEGCL